MARYQNTHINTEEVEEDTANDVKLYHAVMKTENKQIKYKN